MPLEKCDDAIEPAKDLKWEFSARSHHRGFRASHVTAEALQTVNLTLGVFAGTWHKVILPQSMLTPALFFLHGFLY